MGRPAIEDGTAQYRVGKDSLVQDSLVQGSRVEVKDEETLTNSDGNEKDFNKLEPFRKNLMLTDNQIDDLLNQMDLEAFDYYCAKLSNFIEEKGAHVKNHYQTILKWWKEDSVVGVK